MKKYFLFSQNKLSYLGGQLYWAFPFSKGSLLQALPVNTEQIGETWERKDTRAQFCNFKTSFFSCKNLVQSFLVHSFISRKCFFIVSNYAKFIHSSQKKVFHSFILYMFLSYSFHSLLQWKRVIIHYMLKYLHFFHSFISFKIVFIHWYQKKVFSFIFSSGGKKVFQKFISCNSFFIHSLN